MNASYNPQVNSDQYHTSEYLNVKRWSTYAKVIEEVLRLMPKKVLEIGPGNNVVSNILRNIGIDVKTLDYDTLIGPDYKMSISDDELGKITERFDLVIASQILEHVDYEDAKKALCNLRKLTKNIIVTLPYTNLNSFQLGVRLYVNKLGARTFYKKIITKKVRHLFNGQHHWELGKKEYSFRRARRDIRECGWQIMREYINPENPYHYFIILNIDD
jgi:hypothetical protein